MKKSSPLVEILVDLVLVIFVASIAVYGLSMLIPVLFPQIGVVK